jgi:hypothetical protein
MPRTRLQRPARLAFLVVASAYALLGGIWTAEQLGDVPHYGDTLEYLDLATRRGVDRYRGFLYPRFLEAVARARSAPGMLEHFDPESTRQPRCAAPPGLAAVQVLQLALGAGFLFWALWLLRPALLPRRSRPRAAALLVAVALLVLLDPLVAHFHVSVMTDALALSGSLLFCAALSAWRLASARPAAVAPALVAGLFVAGGVRVEKGPLLLATAAASLALWRWRDRGRGEHAGTAAALVQVALPVLVAFSAVTAVQRASFHEYEHRWSMWVSLVHERIVFPHLVDVYDRLPERVRARLSPEDAARYDSSIQEARAVMRAVTRRHRVRPEKLTRDMGTTALRARWAQIVLDVATDAGEHLVPTLSWPARLAVAEAAGRDRYARWSRSEGALWTWEQLSFHHPRLSLAHLLAAGAFLATAGAAALAARRRVGPGPSLARGGLDPFLVFAVTNALAFALSSDLVNVRYALFAHASVVGGLTLLALRAVLPAPPSAAAASSPEPRCPGV